VVDGFSLSSLSLLAFFGGAPEDLGFALDWALDFALGRPAVGELVKLLAIWNRYLHSGGGMITESSLSTGAEGLGFALDLALRRPVGGEQLGC
jgi:hypothetical protein